MKKVVMCAFLAALAGCSSTGNKACCGWRFEILKPPTIETTGTILVNQGPGLMSAQTLAHTAGPIAMPVEAMPLPMPTPSRSPSCSPPSAGLSPEAMRELKRELRLAMPRESEKQE